MNEKIKEIRFDTKRAQCFFQELLAYTIGPIELKDLLDVGKVNLVDVRRFEDYEVSHIPGAISIPKEELADNTNKLSKEEITVPSFLILSITFLLPSFDFASSRANDVAS